jgi:hypothetical protein
MYEGGGVTRLTVPKPPEMAFEGIPFEYGKPSMCPYCFTEQNFKDRAAWKYIILPAYNSKFLQQSSWLIVLQETCFPRP